MLEAMSVGVVRSEGATSCQGMALPPPLPQSLGSTVGNARAPASAPQTLTMPSPFPPSLNIL